MPTPARLKEAKRHFGAPESALLKACRAGRLDAVRELLARGADPLAAHPDLEAHCRSPFGACVQRGHLDCLALLMARFDWAREARLDSRGAFSLAAREGSQEGLDMLFAATPPREAGALRTRCARESPFPLISWGLINQCGPTDRDSHGPVLGLACAKGMLDQSGRLLDEGADPTEADSTGADALWLAACHGHADLCQLLAPLCDPNRLGAKGLTPLMIAIRRGKARAIEVLLPLSDLSVLSSQGDHALGLALRTPYVVDPTPWARLPGFFSLVDRPGSDGRSAREIAAQSVGRSKFLAPVLAAWEARELAMDLGREGSTASSPRSL